MRMDQPHLSTEVADESRGIEFLKTKIKETQEAVDKLTDSKENAQAFLKRQNIDEAVVAEKLSALSKKIKQLNDTITELNQVIEVCTDNYSALYQYFKEHAEKLEESEN